ncbi:hypothetical protein MNV49_007511 [Pseudohyphozyma bogoriensis]|nr:hypothetical protein MNV49_007511 [Pseudohyphozyma bogoriensis]
MDLNYSFDYGQTAIDPYLAATSWSDSPTPALDDDPGVWYTSTSSPFASTSTPSPFASTSSSYYTYPTPEHDWTETTSEPTPFLPPAPSNSTASFAPNAPESYDSSSFLPSPPTDPLSDSLTTDLTDATFGATFSTDDDARANSHAWNWDGLENEGSLRGTYWLGEQYAEKCATVNGVVLDSDGDPATTSETLFGLHASFQQMEKNLDNIDDEPTFPNSFPDWFRYTPPPPILRTDPFDDNFNVDSGAVVWLNPCPRYWFDFHAPTAARIQVILQRAVNLAFQVAAFLFPGRQAAFFPFIAIEGALTHPNNWTWNVHPQGAIPFQNQGVVWSMLRGWFDLNIVLTPAAVGATVDWMEGEVRRTFDFPPPPSTAPPPPRDGDDALGTTSEESATVSDEFDSFFSSTSVSPSSSVAYVYSVPGESTSQLIAATAEEWIEARETRHGQIPHSPKARAEDQPPAPILQQHSLPPLFNFLSLLQLFRYPLGNLLQLFIHTVDNLRQPFFHNYRRIVDCEGSRTPLRQLMSHLSLDHVGTGKASYREGCERSSGDGKGFTQRQKVLRHLQTHTGDRPFVCEVCSKSFSEATTLTQHMRTHTQERPFKCTHPGCQKAFALASALTIHLRTHTGEKPFKCP